MYKRPYSTTMMDLVLRAATVAAPSILEMMSHLSKRNEEIQHWEKHTVTLRPGRWRRRPDHAGSASSGPPLKKRSSAGTAIVLSAHRLPARSTGITVRSACSHAMLMTGGQEIA
jgi:hypothetical protein